mmetsp:Transcript_9895/g.20127  ORF Transcript_9895/g.20127 Transcript_9895/m.20127 type:complete len:245 (+) Transcript_9895:1515-2249(+)
MFPPCTRLTFFLPPSIVFALSTFSVRDLRTMGSMCTSNGNCLTLNIARHVACVFIVIFAQPTFESCVRGWCSRPSSKVSWTSSILLSYRTVGNQFTPSTKPLSMRSGSNQSNMSKISASNLPPLVSTLMIALILLVTSTCPFTTCTNLGSSFPTFMWFVHMTNVSRVLSIGSVYFSIGKSLTTVSFAAASLSSSSVSPLFLTFSCSSLSFLLLFLSRVSYAVCAFLKICTSLPWAQFFQSPQSQ